ncbi:MAG TPA: class I SAM-dependent methyltransferase [Blastocatellia bacterium]|nr:class I SAM-dependent methyltransferase [Blastocatellia bacterium]
MQLSSWSDLDPSFIRRRYNRIANIFPFFEWLFLLPPGIRKKAADRLQLLPGDRVLEIGCGTGRNLRLLREAVGPSGHVYGVDLSEGMLEKAKALRARHGWENVTLIRSDALNYTAPEEVDAVLFSLSYATIPHHKQVLGHAWNQLKPGKNLVIMDAKLPSGILGKLLLPYSVWVMRKTVLGNPLMRPWEELHGLTREFSMEETLFGTYYVCCGKRPLARD